MQCAHRDPSASRLDPRIPLPLRTRECCESVDDETIRTGASTLPAWRRIHWRPSCIRSASIGAKSYPTHVIGLQDTIERGAEEGGQRADEEVSGGKRSGRS